MARGPARLSAGVDHGRAFGRPAEASARAVSGAGGSGAGGSSAAGGAGAEAGEPRVDASPRRCESSAKARDSTTAESPSLPDPTTFSSGAHGTVAGKRRAVRRAGDRALDAWLVASGTRRRIGVLA